MENPANIVQLATLPSGRALNANEAHPFDVFAFAPLLLIHVADASRANHLSNPGALHAFAQALRRSPIGFPFRWNTYAEKRA
jgi:hypothetical protein